MADFCKAHRLPLQGIGKLLLPIHPGDERQLDLLMDRGRANGVEVERIDGQALRQMEPEARQTSAALFVPNTSIVSPAAVIEQLTNEVERLGVTLRCGGTFGLVDAQSKRMDWGGLRIHYGHAINAAGLHADTVAHLFGVGQRYTMLPFKGTYWKLRPEAGFSLRHLIYPVPDLRVPFLGVHTTTALDGTTYLGPTATPALGRENYRGLQGTNILECASMVRRLAAQYAAGHDGFRRLAWREGLRLSKWSFAKAARALLPRLDSSHLQSCDKVGIRAQILDLERRRLVHDFLVEKGSDSTHLLNAISPAFTSAFPLARHVCDHFIPDLKEIHAY